MPTDAANEVHVSPLQTIDEHKLEIDEVCARYGCTVNLENISASQGLTDARVLENSKQFGSNSLPKIKEKHPFLIYLGYMRNLFSIMLILAGLLSIVVFILNNAYVSLYVGIIFILVAFFNAFLEFYQELQSKHVLEGFRAMLEQNTHVIRNGESVEISADDVVAGDLIVLKAGDTIPADARVIRGFNVKVDMSSLTGESVPQERNPERSEQSADKAKCLIFKGSAVTSGEMEAIVIGVGHATLIGTIMSFSMGQFVEEGELGREIEVLVRRIALTAIITGSIFMGVAFIQGLEVSVALDIAIGIIVAFLPQGLPMTVTILLTSAAKRMAKKNVLVKNLQAVETLGSLTVIATDKTGTLTKNQMEVVGAWVDGQLIEDVSENSEVDAYLVRCFAASTLIKLDWKQDVPEDLSKINADATEMGLFRHAVRRKFEFNTFFQNIERVHEIPFDSARKWNLTVIKENGRLRVYIKGAPDKLVPSSTLSDDQKSRFEEAYRHFASNGQRLIGFASKEIQVSELDPYRGDPFELDLHDFEFHGMYSIYDPPKEGVDEAVRVLRGARIRIFMVTGDHPITAKSIARKIGIISGLDAAIIERPEEVDQAMNSSSIVLHGDVIDNLRDDQWSAILKAEELVFARTLPRHKLKIVRQLQNQGEIVGAIGDGVNDGPAIKRANLGISMNKTGSDISKDAAEMVLLDDRFATIVSGVYEGRLIFQNLKKSIRYTLTHIFPEVAAFASWALFLIPPPLTPILVLMVDVGSELGPAISFAYEPPEVDLLSLPPRKRLISRENSKNKFVAFLQRTFVEPFRLHQKGEGLMDAELVRWVYFQGGIIEAIGCFGAYIITFVMRDVPLSSLWRSTNKYFYNASENLVLTTGAIANADQQQTIMRAAQSGYYLSVIIGQLFNLFVTKSRYRHPFRKSALKNRATYIGATCAVLVGAFVVFIPGVQEAFESSFPSALALCAPLLTGLVLLLYEFLRHKLHLLGYFGGPLKPAN